MMGITGSGQTMYQLRLAQPSKFDFKLRVTIRVQAEAKVAAGSEVNPAPR